MRTHYKYLLLLGLLPGNMPASLAQELVRPATEATSVVFNKERMTERDIVVEADGFKLPGTLTLPITASEQHKVPCLILVHGSGPNDRDESIGPNKPFRDLAWGLAERGIATIRYDKRTRVYGANCVPVGRELDYDTEAVDDAVAAVALASSVSEVASDSIFLLGHSLGGTLAPRIAERSDALAGIIILAGLVRPLGETVIEQVTYLSSLSGEMSAAAKAQVEQLRLLVNNAKKAGTVEFDNSLPLPLGLPASYWQMANKYQPTETAAGLEIPILVSQGERDYQVTMLDFTLWQFRLSGKKNAVFKSYPRLNHLMQEGEGKSTPQEYTQPTPVAPYVIEDVAAFIHHQKIQ